MNILTDYFTITCNRICLSGADCIASMIWDVACSLRAFPWLSIIYYLVLATFRAVSVSDVSAF